MIIYVHKVRCNPEDGWGRSLGIQVNILGRYNTREKALDAKLKRDSNKDLTSHDISESWIEEEDVL
jgi:hypothetical protein